jgi:hypothetical protein
MNRNLQNRVYAILHGRTPKDPETTDEEKKESTAETEDKENIYGITDPKMYMDKLSKNIEANYTLDKLTTNIFGMPHQFLPTTDFRFNQNNPVFGFGFFNNIYMEKPIVTLMPGKMLFLPSYSKDNKKLFGSLAADNSEASRNALKELISEEAGTRYYDFTSDYTAYMNYVNLMCRVAAIYLGLDGKDQDGNQYKAPDDGNYRTYDWKKYTTDNGLNDSVPNEDKNLIDHVADFFDQVKDDITVGQRCYVNFYIDPNSSVNESINNTTQASQLEGAFDSLEGIVKEADMLIKSVGGSTVQGFVDKAESMVMDLANTATLGLFKDMLGLGEEVLHGSNLIYPEIWTDSDYSKSFSVQINLASPYGDKESVYLNILVPMFHALALALPRQSSENSFNSPFLIRGYAQGWFSIDMGMVESITIEKGPEQSWTVDGLPTEVKITLSIKELYSNLMMSPSTKPSYFFANQGLIDYLGVACGVDMTIPNIYFNFRLAKAMLTSAFKDIPNMTYYHFTESVRNYLDSIFKRNI